MEQYWAIKSQHPGAILFFRLGDFYEMFYEDAKVGARELGITLTSRTKDTDEPIPLAGVPYHSYLGHATRLLRRGYKVAICEQIGDPKRALGLVERRVVRVLTPGTITEGDLLEAGSANYLVALAEARRRWALAHVDLSTGECALTRASGEEAPARIQDELLRLRPVEILVARGQVAEALAARAHEALGLPEGALSVLDGPRVAKVTLPSGLSGEASVSEPEVALALRVLVGYVETHHGSSLAHFERLRSYGLDDACVIDPATVRNLELLRTQREGELRGSLLWVLDRTRTPMGARLLKRWLLYPMVSVSAIEARLDSVERLVRGLDSARRLREQLGGVYDIPRILAKVAAQTAGPRDLKALAGSLSALPAIRETLAGAGLGDHAAGIGQFADLAGHLDSALVDDPPTGVSEGGIFRSGWSGELDGLVTARTDAQSLVARMEDQERDRTGIRSLKIRYNRVLGYFIEVTKANLSLVPAEYTRKQGMAAGERYTTPGLGEMESTILGAEERARGLEHELFVALRDEVAGAIEALQATARTLAQADAIASLAVVAAEGRYTRPRLGTASVLRVTDARHPVVERVLPGGAFVPNSLSMSPEAGQIVILTGPNMGGKSTFLRQAALLTIMAQMGSFVPAARMELSPVDKVFTRVGASDDLASGQSTFMVEMKETAFILKNATSASLVILDEVGRGTSTFDGLCLAWAIVEHIYRTPTLRPKTLFATHYHELTKLANLYPGIVNLSTSVVEKGQDVIFLHKVVEGPADKSYGVHVAKLAGLPEEILTKARELLVDLEAVEAQDVERKRRRLGVRASGTDSQQIVLFDPAVHPAIEEIRRLDVEGLTPQDALTWLARLKERL